VAVEGYGDTPATIDWTIPASWGSPKPLLQQGQWFLGVTLKRATDGSQEIQLAADGSHADWWVP
jgi:hypothetical protein